MSWLIRGLRSSVGMKYVMALTGLFLFLFVLAHLAGNLLIFAGAEQLNDYAEGIQSLGGLLWVMRGGILTIFIVHIVTAMTLQRRNRAARPKAYAVTKPIKSTHASRAMVSTGIVVLIFVVFHLVHFTVGLVRPEWHAFQDEAGRHDVYSMVVKGFQEIPVALFYIVSMVGLGLHLSHGLASFFQTLGWNQPKYKGLTTLMGRGLTALIIVGNIAMPLACLLGWLELPAWNPYAGGN